MNHPTPERLLIASVALLAACTGSDTPPEAPVAAAPRVVSLTASEYAFEAPDSIPAGWTTLRLSNAGTEVHYGHIVRLEPGRTVQELVDAYTEAIRTSGPRPKWVRRFGGPGGTAPGQTWSVTQYLEPGEYVWICPVEDEAGAPHFGKGEVKSFVVYGDTVAAENRGAEPETDVVVQLADFSFALDSTLRAGRHSVRVENVGAEPHDLVLMKLAPGRTVEDVRTWLNPERARRDDAGAPPPPLESIGHPAGGIAVIAPGMASFFDMEFEAGEYVLVCMTTAPDGRSHLEHGMIEQVTVLGP